MHATKRAAANLKGLAKAVDHARLPRRAPVPKTLYQIVRPGLSSATPRFTLDHVYPSFPPSPASTPLLSDAKTSTGAARIIPDDDALLATLKLALERNAESDAETLLGLYTSSIPSSSSLQSLPKESIKAYKNLANLYIETCTPTSLALLLNLLKTLPHPSIHTSDLRLRLARLAISQPETWIPALQVIAPVEPESWRVPATHRICQALLKVSVKPVLVATLFVEQVSRDPSAAATWPPGIWNEFIRQVDYRTALLLLGAFKAVVKIQQRDAAASGKWTAEQIAEPYTSALWGWTLSRFDDRPDVAAPRAGSAVPKTIASDLMDILGHESAQLPVSFINVWMNAERIVGNYSSAEMLWKTFDTKPRPQPHAISSSASIPGPKSTYTRRTQPSSTSWMVYFKLRKNLVDPPPLRTDIQTMLEMVPQHQRSTRTLNSVLSTLLSGRNAVPDLPLLVYLLGLYDHDARGWFGPAPDGRTINLAVSALIRVWRMGGPALDSAFVSNLARQVRGQTSTWSEQRAVASDLHEKEWMLASVALSELVRNSQGNILSSKTPSTLVPLHTTESSTISRMTRVRAKRDNPNIGRIFNPPEPLEEDVDDLGRITDPQNPRSMCLSDPVEPLHPSDPETERRAEEARMMLRPVTFLAERMLKLCLAERYSSQGELDEAFNKVVARVHDDLVRDPICAWVREDHGDWMPVRTDKDS